MNPNWTNSRAPLTFLNTTEEEIPPYACMELDYFAEAGLSACELSTDQQDVVWRVKKPTAAAETDPERIVFNGPSKVPPDSRGIFTTDPFTLAAFDYVDGPPVVAGTVGPKEDSWYLTADGSLFSFKSLDSARAYYLDADRRSIWIQVRGGAGDESHFLFTLTGTISSGAGAATIRNMADTTEIETGASVKDPLGHFGGLTSGYRGICVKSGGEYYALGPYVTSVNWSDPTLRYSRNGGSLWFTIDTAVNCP